LRFGFEITMYVANR
ncbi:MAG: pyrroloquinoline quinone precursor peptide PqqA, partial [Methyloversatilis sp.]|nr:pyrroloquinoline quinone precursor peptide PqqA [Methyloversatilis sp.]